MLDLIVSKFLSPLLEVLYDYAVLVGDSLYVPVESLEYFVIDVISAVSKVLFRIEAFATFFVFSFALLAAAAIVFVKAVFWRRQVKKTSCPAPADEDN